MTTMSLASPCIQRIQRARRRRYPGPGADWYNRATCIEHLEKARQRTTNGREGGWRSRGSEITFWRLALTVAAAHHRAQAGDRTAQYRLAWRKAVRKWRAHAEWLQSRFWAIDREIERITRLGPPCAGCAGRLERLGENRALYLAEIATLPGLTTYAEFVREGPPPTRAAEDEDTDTVTPEQTLALAEAGISTSRQATYQRRMSSLLAGRS